MFHGLRRRLQTEHGMVAVAAFAASACVGSIDAPRNWGDDPGALSANNDGATAYSGSGTVGPNGTSTGASGLPGVTGSGAPNGSLSPMSQGVSPAGKACTVGTSPLRRLTHAEYNNSVRDLLGDSTHPADEFAIDTQVGLFDNSAISQTVPTLLADQYFETAVALAEGVSDVKTLLGCDPAATSSGTTCVRSFIGSFGRRAYRRALTTEESNSLFALFTDARTASDAPTGVRGVIAAVLVSPHFLYRPEFGGLDSAYGNGTKQVTQYEQASRMASLLWASAPDDELLDAAEANQLSTPAQIEAQARRMLADPKSKPAQAAFYDQWLGLELLDSATKDMAVYPGFDESLRAAMVEERHQFVSHVLWQDDARLDTLLTADYSFVNGPLASLYGVSAGSTGSDTFKQVSLDPTQRAGVMTQAAMLAAFARPDESSPVKRGKWVRTRMLCGELGEPPPGIPQLPAIAAGVTNRERFEMHVSDPTCNSCHKLIDGLGYGLEHYDGVGAYRTTNQGDAVDASGEVTFSDVDGAYSGGPELAARLANSQQVQDCVPTQAIRYAWGRLETSDDACSVATVQKAFNDSDGDLGEMMVALTQNDTFTNYRLPD